MAIGSDAEGSGIEDVAAYLVRHGARATTKVIPQVQVGVSEDLMDLAQEVGAGVIVMGAYGHSRLREWMLGGVTADLLAGASTCCLMSH